MSFDEANWWGTCGSTFHEEQKQLVYAPRMGLRPNWSCAHPPEFDLMDRSVVDIGGGPASLLIKCINKGRAVVADPSTFPEWVTARYEACGIEYWRMEGESPSLSGYTFDEAWIYNVLQHVVDPEKVISNARGVASMLRIFEWIDIPAYEGHPHVLTKEKLDEWIDGDGYTVQLNTDGAVGRAYYGVFAV
jgi:hypothetical protein